MKTPKFLGVWIGPLSSLAAIAAFHLWATGLFDLSRIEKALPFLLLFAFVCACLFVFPMRRGLLFVTPLLMWASAAAIYWWPAEDHFGWHGGDHVLRECCSGFAFIPVLIGASVSGLAIVLACFGLPIFNRLYGKLPFVIPVAELGFILFVQWVALYVYYESAMSFDIPEVQTRSAILAQRFFFGGPFFWLAVSANVLADGLVFGKLILRHAFRGK